MDKIRWGGSFGRHSADLLGSCGHARPLLLDRGMEFGGAGKVGQLSGGVEPLLDQPVGPHLDHIGGDAVAQLRRHFLGCEKSNQAVERESGSARLGDSGQMERVRC